MHSREAYAKREIRDLDPPSIPAPPCQYHVLYYAWQQISMPIFVMWSACLLRHSPIIDGGRRAKLTPAAELTIQPSREKCPPAKQAIDFPYTTTAYTWHTPTLLKTILLFSLVMI
jgi:hypothetical protein